jgi:hypothetical protein
VFSSEWLDIAIGVVLVWFLFALAVSGINEGMVRLLALRTKQLWKGLSQMLDGSESPKGLVSELVGLPRWPGRPADPHPGGGAPITAKIYATKTVQGLEPRTGSNQKTRIHNIPGQVFAQALLELATTAQGADPLVKVQNYINNLGDSVPLKAQLQTILHAANNDVTQFQTGVERWFDGQMTRLSGIYKSRVRVVLVVIGIVVSVGGFGLGMRSDALRLVSDLQHDSNLRTLVVGAANQAASTDLAKGCDTSAPATPNVAACQLKGVSGLKSIDLSIHDAVPTPRASLGQRLGFLLPWRNWKAALGVLITAIAISFGASFWYTALKRLVGLRGGSQTAPAA